MKDSSTIPSTLPKLLWTFISKQRIAFFYILLTTTIWSINETLFPYFIKLIVNTLAVYKGNTNDIFEALKTPLFYLGGLWLAMEFSMRTQGFTVCYTYPKFRANIRSALYTYTKGHSHSFFSNNYAGNLSGKIADLPNSAEAIIDMTLWFIVPLILIISLSFSVMWNAHPYFAFIFIAWFLFHLGIVILFMGKSRSLAKSHATSVTELSGKIVDTFTNIQSVRLFARKEFEFDFFRKQQDIEIKKSFAASLALEKMKIFLGLGSLLLIFGMMFTLIKGWQEGWATLGDFSLIALSTFNVMGFVWHSSFMLSKIVREWGKANAALSLVNTPHEIVDAPNAKQLKVKEGKIEFRDVTFTYHADKPIFKNFNISLEKGQKIGLVGLSGAGKSSFVNLILRFYNIDSGAILVDGQNIAEVTQDSLRENISMIPQDPSLFHRSLIENIRYGNIGATDEQVIEASKKAHCHEFVQALDDGYSTLVGERGIRLSGGQRQRIAIARAMLKNAPILILDEATSSLDSITEKLIQDSLINIMRGKTTIIIAHRLSTLSSMDRILVFDQGKIVEDGNKEELLKKNGYFSKLWNMQVNGFLPD